MVQPAAIDSSLSVERDIAATRQQVWNVIADGWTYSQWVVGNARMRAVDRRWPAPGALIHHTIGIWLVVLDDETEVESSTPFEELILLAKGRPFGARITLRLSDSGAGCRVEMAEVPVGGPLNWVPRRLALAAAYPRNRECRMPGPVGRSRGTAGRTEVSHQSADAVVIGAGHNGLVAAAMLADAGWDVVVLEAQSEPGGAVKSAELFPGYVSDLYSAFYPLSVASPALKALHLEDHGLQWTHAPAVVGHPRSAEDDDAPVIYHEIDRTADDLERRQQGDGDRWCALFDQWLRIKDALLATLFAPFPPVRGPAQLLRELGSAEALRLAHLMLLPAGVMAQRLFEGDAARLLLLGNAMHADVPIDAPGSGVMGYLLIMMAQDGGWPVPVGGAGQLTKALVNRARAAGAHIECGREVDAIEISAGRAVAVRDTDGSTVRVRRAVIADTSAPRLYGHLLPSHAVPAAVVRELKHFVWDTPVLKINYALDSPIPWRSKSLNDVGTVHVGADHDGLVRWMADLNTATVPLHPFMLFGQMSTADPSRSPIGTESAWAYTHLPRGVADDASADQLSAAVDVVLDKYAPGFSEKVIGKTIQRPSDLEASDANLHSGAVNGGTSQLYQQLIFRPAPGFGRAETSVENVYLGSAGATPGGGVHGVCGRNAARAAIAGDGAHGWPRRRLTRTMITLTTR